MGVTIRVTIYELKSRSALRYHFCFSLPSQADASLPPSGDGSAVTVVKTEPIESSSVCFEEAGCRPAGATRPSFCPMSSLRSFESDAGSICSSGSASNSNVIGTSTFCRAFPWHFMVDRSLNFVQLGVGFMRLFGAELKRTGRHLATYFQLKKPAVEFNFDKILKKANSPFVLAISYVPGKDSLKSKLQVTIVSLFLYPRAGWGRKLITGRETEQKRAPCLIGFPLH